MSLKQLAAKHGVTDRAISIRKAADAKAGMAWVRQLPRGGTSVDNSTAAPPSSNADEKATEKATENAASRSTLTGMRGGRLVPPYEPSDITDEQLAVALRATAMRALADLDAGLIHPGMNQSYADVVKNVVAAAASAIQASRDVSGKKPGVPSSEAEADWTEGSDEVGVIFEHRVIESSIDSAAS